MRKKILAIICTGVLLTATACGNTSATAPVGNSEAVSSETSDSEAAGSESTVPAGSEEESESETKCTYTSGKITANTGEHDVVGVLYMPECSTDVPAVVVCHGFGANFSYYTSLCSKLAEAGIAAVGIDFYGGGPGSMSGGEMNEMTVFTEQADLDAMLDLLRQTEGIDSSRIALIGHSQGGFVSTLVACEHPDEISGLYLIAPAYHIPDAMREAFPSYDEIYEFQSGSYTVGVPYVQAVYDYDIYPEMSKYTGKVHIWHGTLDTQVDMSYSEQAAETFANCTLTKVEGMDHNTYSRVANEMVAEIAADLGAEK